MSRLLLRNTNLLNLVSCINDQLKTSGNDLARKVASEKTGVTLKIG